MTTTSAPLLPLSEVSERLREAVTSIVAPEQLSAMPDDELLALLRVAEELGRAVDGLRVLASGEVGERSRATLGPERLSARSGCHSPAELIERIGCVSGQVARSRLRLAERLRPGYSLTGELLPGAFPAVREAVTSGTLGIEAAAAIIEPLAPVLDRGSILASLTGADGIRSAERELVEAAAAGEPADGVRIMAQTWALFLDPDGPLREDDRGRRERGLTLGRPRHGTVPIRGVLMPEVAAQLQRLLDAYLNPRVDEQGPHFVPDAPDDAPPVHDDLEQRTPAQRRHDALAGILSVAASSDGAPRLGGGAPTLVVTVTPDQLDDPSGLAFLQGGAQDAAAVPASVARHIGCAGAVQRLVLDSAGRIVELGTVQRIFNAHQRRAIMVRDGECVIPGCHVPAPWCEIHHVVPHARGGPTHTDNGVPLCWHHHRTIDTGGWQIEMRAGLPWVRPPGWIDPHRTWQPGGSATMRAWLTLRRDDEAGPDPGS